MSKHIVINYYFQLFGTRARCHCVLIPCSRVVQRVWPEGGDTEADCEATAAPPGGPRQERAGGGQVVGGGDLPLDRSSHETTAVQSQASAGM